MEEISQEDLDKAIALNPESLKVEKKELNEVEFNNLIEDMKNPVKAQQRLAVQVKIFLDERIEEEMKDRGILSDHTRRWVESYNNILEKIQKALHGDRSVNLHLHKVTHSQIATKMREFS